MTGAWSIMMRRDIENFHDKIVKHCDENNMEPFDDKSHGAY